MNRLEIVKQKAKEKLTEDQFKLLDIHISTSGVSGSKQANLWEDVLNGKMILNTWIEPDNLSDEELTKIDNDIESRGTEAILDILDKQMMIPDNLKTLLRKKYNKQLVEAKEIIHRKKYFGELK